VQAASESDGSSADETGAASRVVIITSTQTVSFKNLGIVITGKTVQWTDPQYASEVLCTTSNDMDIMLNTHTLLSVDNNQALWKEASASSFVTV
tara:strand:+ start:65 stop:346 length:282 start_codon:yes stop_codon:yes gene_type:complete